MTLQPLNEHLNSTTRLSDVDPLKADFRNFVYAIWKHLGLPDPTDVQYDIAQWLQYGPKRLVTEAFRGVGKSWITAAFVLWVLYCDPQKKIMVVSANAPKAAEFSTFCLQLIAEVPFLRHLQPRHDQRQSTKWFDVGPAKPDQSPSVKSVGITGQLTGSRSDLIVADDIEIPHNSDTVGKRERILELVKEFDAVLKPGGRIVYLGTPQTEQSIYSTLESRGYVIRIWPARYPKDPKGKLDALAYADKKYAHRLAPYIRKRLSSETAGAPVDPKRFNSDDLRERELSYGRSGFALQFMLDTSLSDEDKYPLKLSDLIVHPLDPFRAPMDLVWASSPELAFTDLQNVGLFGDRYFRPAWYSPDFAPYDSSVMFVDPSGRGKDETAYVVVKLLNGRLFLTAAGGYLGGYDDATLSGLLAVAKRHQVPLMKVEPNFGAGVFTRLLQAKAVQEGATVGIEDAEWASTMKEKRIIDTLEPILNQHRLVVSPEVIQQDYDSVLSRDGERAPEYRLFYQLARMVREKDALAVDDRLDALAGACDHFQEALGRDSHMGLMQHKQSALDRELEKFVQHAMGGKSGGQRPWASSLMQGRRGRIN